MRRIGVLMNTAVEDAQLRVKHFAFNPFTLQQRQWFASGPRDSLNPRIRARLRWGERAATAPRGWVTPFDGDRADEVTCLARGRKADHRLGFVPPERRREHA